VVFDRERPAYVIVHPDDHGRTAASRRGRPLGEALALLGQGAPPDPGFAEDMEAVVDAVGPAPADPWTQSETPPVFIELERAMRGLPAVQGMTDVARRLESQLGENEEVGTAATPASELSHGVHRATEEQRGKRAAFVEAVLAAFPTLSFDLLVARVHTRLWAGLASSGADVGAHDRLVAATAMSAGWRVGTADARHFDGIPGLEMTPLQMT
jgi:tRNA(fMet)-specific endonuclease VapC